MAPEPTPHRKCVPKGELDTLRTSSSGPRSPMVGHDLFDLPSAVPEPDAPVSAVWKGQMDPGVGDRPGARDDMLRCF